ncbi:peptidylprolyl isomerase [Faunimonas pinastri]|uniref:peptidylprolyl isomerase n=1 Tax=Faunimonas pinastri TaxID=1855383 RepID=UPI0015A71006|nr:SurA N-terminal domain-containing protein [Faunimonas pinastri]
MLAFALAASALVGMHSAPAMAQSAIKVIVNNQPITSYDVSARAKLLKLTSHGKAGEKQAVDELIDETLQMQEAQKRGIKVSDQELAQAFGQIAQRTKLPPEKLEMALRQSGVDPQSLKNRIKAQLLWSQVVRARFRATVQISDRDISQALAKKGDAAEENKKESISSYDVQPVVFVVPKQNGSGVESQRQQEANSFRARYKGCDTALAVAKAFPGAVVRPTVRRDETEVNPDTAKELAATPIGGVTKPVRIDTGFQVLGVCAKRSVPGQSKAADKVKDELANEQGDLLARRYLRDLRADAVIQYR